MNIKPPCADLLSVHGGFGLFYIYQIKLNLLAA